MSGDADEPAASTVRAVDGGGAPPANADAPHPPVLPELDPVIHAQPPLRIVVALATLAAGDRVTRPRLQELVGMTPGNLSTHLRKLEAAGYLSVEKSFRRRTPVTWLSVTDAGRRALDDYTAALRRLLDGAGRPVPAESRA
jgi:DNA-binding transcriptional ArsR family regulator